MPEFDLLIRDVEPIPEIGIADGKIISFGGGPAREEMDATVGRALTGRVVQTILRGKTIFKDGQMVSPPIGRLVKPQR